MQILYWDDILDKKDIIKNPVAVTIGVFDGLHLGHQRLLDAVKTNTPGIMSLVVSFKNNPAKVLKADSFLGDINSYTQKLKNFQLYGIDSLLLIDFSLDFSKMTGREFWDVLLNKFAIRKIVAGENFYFGKQRDTGIHNLSQLAGTCEIKTIPQVREKGVVVSSTQIRQCILQGEIKKANILLFQKYALDMEHISKDTDESYLFRKNIEQVVPKPDQYVVAFRSNQFLEKGLVEVDTEMIRLIKPGSINIENIQEIIFIEKA